MNRHRKCTQKRAVNWNKLKFWRKMEVWLKITARAISYTANLMWSRLWFHITLSSVMTLVIYVGKCNVKSFVFRARCSLYLHALQKASESLEPGQALCILLSVHYFRLYLQLRNNCAGPPPMAQHQVLHICQLILQWIEFVSMLDLSGPSIHI